MARMQLNLTTWQRVQLSLIIGATKGAASTIRKAVKLLDMLEMNDEEKAAVGFEQKGPSFTWKDADTRWAVEIKDGNLESFLVETVKAYDKWPVDVNVIDLLDQLGIE